MTKDNEILPEVKPIFEYGVLSEETGRVFLCGLNFLSLDVAKMPGYTLVHRILNCHSAVEWEPVTRAVAAQEGK